MGQIASFRKGSKMVTENVHERASKTMTSPSTGLIPNQVGFWGLVFQGLGGIAPIGIFFALIGTANFVQGAMALVFIVGFIGVLLSANTLYWYSRKIANARGYYGYVKDGLGNHAATFTAYSYVFYAASNAAGLILFYLVGFSGSINLVFNTNFPWWTGIIFAGMGLAVVFYGMWSGLKPSIRVMIALGLLQMAVLTVISIIFIVKAPDNSIKPFTPYTGISALFLGFVTGGYLAYGGYGSIISLGEETKAPNKTVGKALITILIIGAFAWILASYATAVAWGLGNMKSFVTAEVPAAILTNRYIGVGATAVMTLLYDIVIYTLLNNFLTSGSRVVYAMGRDNLLPASLSKVDPKRGVPVGGIVAITGITILLAGISTAILVTKYGVPNGIIDSYIVLGILTTLLALLVHGMASISIIWSGIKKRFGNLDGGKITLLIIVPLISVVLTIAAVYYAILGITFPFAAAPIIFALFCVVLVIALAIRRNKVPELLPIGEIK